MTLENEVKAVETPKAEPKEGFIKGWWDDSFNRKGEPNFSKNYKKGVLCYLGLGAVIFGLCFWNESINMRMAEELPTKIVRFEEGLDNEQFRADIIKYYVPDEGMRRYALERVEELNANNPCTNTLIIPYIPKK